MKRKISQIGPTTLMVSLPAKWVKENNLKKGQELEVIQNNKELILKTEQRQNQEITLDISEFDRKRLVRTLEILYFSGYTKIIMNYKNTLIFNPRKNKNEDMKKKIQELVQRFIGLEIISQTENKVELSCFLHEKQEDLKEIENKIITIIIEYMREFKKKIKEKKRELIKDSQMQHDNITKFIGYYLRVLNSSSYNEYQRQQIVSIYFDIDSIIDKFPQISEKIEEKGYSKNTLLIVNKLFELFEAFLNSLKKEEISSEVIKARYKVEKELENIELRDQEIVIYGALRGIMDLLKPIMRVIIVKKTFSKV